MRRRPSATRTLDPGSRLAAAVPLTLILMLVTVAAAPAQHLRCVPSCAADDGRMLALTDGEGLDTLTITTLDVILRVPATQASFRLDFFDGEVGGLWDLAFAPGDTSQEKMTYTLYADPKGDGTGSKVVATFDGETMADNAWSEFIIPNDDKALQKKGALYVYRLEAVLDPFLLATRSTFKLRTDEIVALTVMGQRGNGAHGDPGPFAFIAALASWEELAIIYPGCKGQPLPVCLGSLGNSTYDGTFSFFIEVSEEQEQLNLWDGDFDHGNFDTTNPDDDDFNTWDKEYPPFVKGQGRTAYWEGVAAGCCVGGSRDGLPCRPAPGDKPYCPGGGCDVTGDPPDDFDASLGGGLGAIWVRPGSVEYDVLGPAGGVIGACENPAGNDEWELFRLAVPGTGGYYDHHGLPPEEDVAALPAGIYEVRVRNLDLENLGAFCLPNFQPKTNGEGCTPGYWKQPHHFDSWVGYRPSDRYGDIFGISPSFGNVTLLQALQLGGGGERALARHAVAALLNATSPGTDAGFTAAGTIHLVQLAYDSGGFETLKDRLAAANEQGCPLNAGSPQVRFLM